MEYFVREVARLGPVSNFDFTALLTKVASNVLMTCEHLRRYLKVSWSMLSIFYVFSDPEFIKWRVRSTGVGLISQDPFSLDGVSRGENLFYTSGSQTTPIECQQRFFMPQVLPLGRDARSAETFT